MAYSASLFFSKQNKIPIFHWKQLIHLRMKLFFLAYYYTIHLSIIKKNVVCVLASQLAIAKA